MLANRIVLSAVLALGASVGQTALAKANQITAKGSSPQDDELKEAAQTGSQSQQSLWEKAEKLRKAPGISLENKGAILLVEAQILLRAGYPVLAASYAAEGLKLKADPFDPSLHRAWDLLSQVIKVRQVHYILEDLAVALTPKLGAKLPPVFGNDWNYIQGNALAAAGKDNLAFDFYKKVRLADRYFMPAQYQAAMIAINDGKEGEAEVLLKAILNPTAVAISPLPAQDRFEMRNYALMALGRLYYQRREFVESVKSYRKVAKTSPLFYDALFEQSWALFMSGYPGHSLGSLHSVGSPFFKTQFNPEAKVLEAIEYYWICRYDESRNALADFADKHYEAVESLGNFLNRQRLSPTAAYQLFEDVISGVSGQSIGIPRDVLVTAAQRDTMLLVRDQFATVIEEKNRLDSKGLFKDEEGASQLKDRLEGHVQKLRLALGTQYIEELRGMKSQFEDLYAQSQFLYLELLMSEKERTLGHELHSESKLTSVTANLDIKGWGKKTQYWNGGVDSEFWWDEVGYYVIRVQPACNLR